MIDVAKGKAQAANYLHPLKSFIVALAKEEALKIATGQMSGGGHHTYYGEIRMVPSNFSEKGEMHVYIVTIAALAVLEFEMDWTSYKSTPELVVDAAVNQISIIANAMKMVTTFSPSDNDQLSYGIQNVKDWTSDSLDYQSIFKSLRSMEENSFLFAWSDYESGNYAMFSSYVDRDDPFNSNWLAQHKLEEFKRASFQNSSRDVRMRVINQLQC